MVLHSACSHVVAGLCDVSISMSKLHPWLLGFVVLHLAHIYALWRCVLHIYICQWLQDCVVLLLSCLHVPVVAGLCGITYGMPRYDVPNVTRIAMAWQPYYRAPQCAECNTCSCCPSIGISQCAECNTYSQHLSTDLSQCAECNTYSQHHSIGTSQCAKCNTTPPCNNR